MGAVLAWFAITVLRGQGHRFAFGCLVSGLVALAALNFTNPEGIVARVNIARSRSDQPFDSYYLARLSADAYLPLTKHVGHVSPDERCEILETMRRGLERQSREWRGWNLSRHRAREAFWVYDRQPGNHC